MHWVSENSFFYPDNLAGLVVHVCANYNKEIFLGNVTIHTKLLSTTYFKLIFEQNIFSNINDEISCVSGKVELIFVDKKTKTPTRTKDLITY
jgi:acyl-CoA thioesterase FadM